MSIRFTFQEAAEFALLFSERRMADALKILDWRCKDDDPVNTQLSKLVTQPRRRGELDSLFYQKVHDESAMFQQNNWLLSEVETIRTSGSKIIVELGCGNGKFLKAIAPYVDYVTGLDWAQSPALNPLPKNAAFLQRDILNDEIPKCDSVCSADFLEHFTPDEIEPLLKKISNCAPKQYHVISCYDDGHSHLTIMPPAAWLATFRRIDSSSTLIKVSIRRNDPRQLICIIKN